MKHEPYTFLDKTSLSLDGFPFKAEIGRLGHIIQQDCIYNLLQWVIQKHDTKNVFGFITGLSVKIAILPEIITKPPASISKCENDLTPQSTKFE